MYVYINIQKVFYVRKRMDLFDMINEFGNRKEYI